MKPEIKIDRFIEIIKKINKEILDLSYRPLQQSFNSSDNFIFIIYLLTLSYPSL